MKYCTRCGNPANDDAQKFCMKCGNPFQDIAKSTEAENNTGFEWQESEMGRSIKQKYKKAKKLKKVAIVLGALLITGFFAVFYGDICKYDQTGILFLSYNLLTFVGLIFLCYYFSAYLPLERSMSILRQDIEYYLQGIDERALLPESGVYCGMNALVLKKTGVIIPYEEILWVYRHTVRVSGIPFVNCLNIHTYHNKGFFLKMDDYELAWFLENFKHKLTPDLIFGYGDKQRKKYNELRVKK